ncbi:Hypp3945 [Branchiostoma lanceolatum]|uniref:Hypp3945 protein n=1 Tax=Branchiostoma lanceolatum TaxID=7740 RepID=A0A8K0EW71_BRALA|nr:Hypp3945 [Branchiostoma lanceolatum]
MRVAGKQIALPCDILVWSPCPGIALPSGSLCRIGRPVLGSPCRLVALPCDILVRSPCSLVALPWDRPAVPDRPAV